MKYVCEKQSKIDRLWGYFIQNLLEMRDAGIKVEYVRKGEVVLNGIRYEPVYFEKTMQWNPIDRKQGAKYIITTGHDVRPLIEYLVKFNVSAYMFDAERKDTGDTITGYLWRGADRSFIIPGNLGLNWLGDEQRLQAYAVEVDPASIREHKNLAF